MKELKFRIWNNNHNEFIRPDYGLIGFCYPLDGRIAVLTSNGDPIEDCVIEQYTGLKDKNGKEIYEGDIVRYKLYADSRLDYIDEVFYSTISGAFMAGDEDNIRTLDCLVNVEIIGNIHENAELLGGE